MISVSWRLSCNVFSGILGDSVDLVQTGNGVTSLWTVKVVILARMQEVPDLRNHNSFRRLLMSINCELLSLPFFVYPPGPESWCWIRRRSRGPNSRVLQHSWSRAACTRHNTWKYGPGLSPVSWAWRPCNRHAPCSMPRLQGLELWRRVRRLHRVKVKRKRPISFKFWGRWIGFVLAHSSLSRDV